MLYAPALVVSTPLNDRKILLYQYVLLFGIRSTRIEEIVRIVGSYGSCAKPQYWW